MDPTRTRVYRDPWIVSNMATAESQGFLVFDYRSVDKEGLKGYGVSYFWAEQPDS